MSTGSGLSLGLVVPVFNEATGIADFHRHLVEVTSRLPVRTTFYYVNDGSTDATETVLEEIARTNERVVLIELSRNFGHQAALSAGIDVARGDVVVTLDGDGQHPPELIEAMLKLHDTGYDVVLAQRSYSKDASFGKRFTSELFYKVLRRIGDTEITPGCADYRLMSRRAVDALKAMPEYHRFLRGMVAWLGFRTVILPYHELARTEGRSKHTLRKMLRLASDAVSSFSLVPLRIGIALGLGFLVLAALEMAYVAYVWVRGEHDRLVPGWSSLMFAILLVGGLGMVLLGLVGSYVGYIFQEVKRRPVYVIRALRTPTPDPLSPEHSPEDAPVRSLASDGAGS